MSDDGLTVLRKVYFFRVESFDHVVESLPHSLQRIKDLPFDDDGRYHHDSTTRNRFLIYPDAVEYPLKVRFCRLRRDLLPQVESAGNLSDLVLQEDEGLIDISHMMIFSDGFVAAEWNPEGPKIAKLGDYLMFKGKLNASPKFYPLIEREMVEIIGSMSAINFMEIEVPASNADLVREIDQGLFKALDAAKEIGATKTITLKLKSTMGNVNFEKIINTIVERVSNFSQDRDIFNKVIAGGKVGGKGGVKKVDILETKLVSLEEFEKNSPRSRGIDSESAYSTLEKSYFDNRGRIERAAFVVEELIR